MFHKCYQLVQPIVRTKSQFILSVNQDYANTLISKRWAGHSKWQNIRHVKGETDAQRNTDFQRLGKKIIIEVKNGGPNPDFNFKLRQIIRDCVKINMPKSTIENFIKQGEKYTGTPVWVLFSGNNGFIVASETRYGNIKHAVTKLTPYFKKLGLKPEKALTGFCEEKGYIYSDPKNKNDSNSYNTAVEDAIEIGIDEVVEADDKTLVFECKPNMLDVAQKKLCDKGYNVISANSEIEFNNFIKLSEIEMKAFNSVMQNAQQNCEIIRMVHNAEPN